MRPRMIVVAGPPGSGKSTVFRPDKTLVAYFNADERARELNNGSGRNIPREIRVAVNREMEAFIADHIRRKESFAYETTLRTAITFHQAQSAKARGFDTIMQYVALNSTDEAIRRVRARSEQGGHSAPPERIREIYQASIRNLPQAIREFSNVTVYDNTDASASGPSRVLESVDGEIVDLADNTPEWVEKALMGTAYELAKIPRTRRFLDADAQC